MQFYTTDMSTIVPAILPTSHDDLVEKLKQLDGIATDVQIDIVDGMYASPASWPYAGNATGSIDLAGGLLPCLDQFHMEVDLMVHDPEQVTGMWIQTGATRILAHLESTTYLPQLITDLKEKYGHEKGFGANLLSFGIALNVDTKLEFVEPYIADMDYVQFMGIKNIGKQGQPFAPEVLTQIAAFRKRHPDMPIQVDGGVTLANAAMLLDAGVSRLVVGSALWKAPDVGKAYAALAALTDTHGLYN
jgi:ribulose-phosphate 3-epimerase